MESTLVLLGILILAIVIIAALLLVTWYLKEQIQDHAFFIMGSNDEKIEVAKATNEELGYVLSEIINRSGDDLTDGECLDQVISYLKRHDLYHEGT
jgi:hypothetical protein